MKYPTRDELKLMWTTEDICIGRTLLSVKELEELFDTRYRRVVKKELYEIEVSFDEFGEMEFYYDKKRIEEARQRFKIDGMKVECYRPDEECPAFLTWKMMNGGVLVAPRVLG